ncbi:mif4g-domain-containing protein [Malassezia pachydermatis]|uniref:Mif4g-domain-containing protein n=1 Tax=Malassezia pachydermatis TaxID=77020 RepID=A0A0M8MRV4_9BASI|nr:mif4g-domain-containing protein [Malassezia pachydermatis]KOS12530.1 mif4g-domain-containing protein [Malassezia pachydermatis]
MAEEERVSKRKRSLSPEQGEAKHEEKMEKGEALRSALAKLAETRAGGAYVPPARLRALMAEVARADSGSAEFQRMNWEALRKSITGLVNKVAADNIKHIAPELFAGANLIRGRGLFCRSIMHAQELSLPFTPVFAALAAIINTKLPFVGELLVTRLVMQFRRAFRRNDKTKCHATLLFLAHLTNQRVVHELLALEILVLLLEKPTDDSVELAVAFMREVGAFLTEEAPKACHSVFDRFRSVLYEGNISVRVQYMIEVLAQTRKDKFQDNPRIPEQLDLVEEEDQITHQVSLDDQLNIEEGLNIFKLDPDFEANEEKYRQIKAEILGENSDEDASEDDDDDDVDEEEEDVDEAAPQGETELEIHDRTETNLVNLRRTIYLVIMSSLDFEECVHKILKLRVPEDQEMELCNMVIECCSQERTYSKFYGHIGERLCKLHRRWSGLYEQSFRTYYDTIHRYETNRLRNIARFFGQLLATDAISWASFDAIYMNEDDTTSSSRIFVKILFQEMQSLLGIKTLTERFKEPTMQEYYQNMFPLDHPRNTRFSINFFTSIGLGVLTESMREYLQTATKAMMERREAEMARGDESDASMSDRSYSRSPRRGRSRTRSYTPSSRSPARIRVVHVVVHTRDRILGAHGAERTLAPTLEAREADRTLAPTREALEADRTLAPTLEAREADRILVPTREALEAGRILVPTREAREADRTLAPILGVREADRTLVPTLEAREADRTHAARPPPAREAEERVRARSPGRRRWDDNARAAPVSLSRAPPGPPPRRPPHLS